MTVIVRPDAINSGMNFGKYIQRRNEKTFVFDTCDHAFNDAVLRSIHELFLFMRWQCLRCVQ